MPSNLDQATGPEREQYLAALEGKKRFITEPQPPKHFGTKQNPVVIYTHFDERQVGCQGASSLPPAWLPAGGHDAEAQTHAVATAAVAVLQGRARTRRSRAGQSGGR